MRATTAIMGAREGASPRKLTTLITPVSYLYSCSPRRDKLAMDSCFFFAIVVSFENQRCLSETGTHH